MSVASKMPLPPTSGLGTQHIGESEKLTATANSWRAMKAAIGLAAGGDLTITLSALFECEYDSQIVIPSNTNVITILGNGAVLDAARKGRFFNLLGSGSSLLLDSLTMQHGTGLPPDPQSGHINGGAITDDYHSTQFDVFLE